MSDRQTHHFGRVDEKGDAFEFAIDASDTGECNLVAVVQTERGPRRTRVAAVPVRIWNAVAALVARELGAGMSENERDKKLPIFHLGLNRLSPLVGRELGVLLIVLMEDPAGERVDALVHAWRELAREERWWLYSKAAAPRQRPGAGWRRALFHALSETSETRSAPTEEAKKQLREHRDEVFASGPPEPYCKGSKTAHATTSQGGSSGVQQKASHGRKGKADKSAENDPQIELF
jgi:hypothetical protein